MTRSLGPSLPPPLVERLAQRDPGARLGVALPFVTVDGHGHPHPMLLSYLELRAYDTRTVGLVIGTRSRSAQNLAERRAGTLLEVLRAAAPRTDRKSTRLNSSHLVISYAVFC